MICIKSQILNKLLLFQIPGNKMNSKNLAIIIGPNILHKVCKGWNKN